MAGREGPCRPARMVLRKLIQWLAAMRAKNVSPAGIVAATMARDAVGATGEARIMFYVLTDPDQVWIFN